MNSERETEDRILDAAHAVILRRGTAGARMREIADEAGVNTALLHYYFRSKERLAEAVFRRAAHRLFPPLIQVMTSDVPLEEKVRRFVDHQHDMLAATPDLPGYLLSEMHHHPERLEQLFTSVAGTSPREFAPRILSSLRGQIEEAVRAGRIRPIAPEQFLVNLVSLCIYPFAARPMLTVLLGGGPDGFRGLIEERRRTLADYFLSGLRP